MPGTSHASIAANEISVWFCLHYPTNDNG